MSEKLFPQHKELLSALFTGFVLTWHSLFLGVFTNYGCFTQAPHFVFCMKAQDPFQPLSVDYFIQFGKMDVRSDAGTSNTVIPLYGC